MELQGFQTLLAGRVDRLRGQAQEMDQEARLIEVAWDARNVDDLLVLKAINPTQAMELRRLLEDPAVI